MTEAFIFLSGMLLGIIIGALGAAHVFKKKIFNNSLGSEGSPADMMNDVVDSEEGEDVDPDQMIEAASEMMEMFTDQSEGDDEDDKEN